MGDLIEGMTRRFEEQSSLGGWTGRCTGHVPLGIQHGQTPNKVPTEPRSRTWDCGRIETKGF